MTTKEERRRRRASALLAILLLVLAVILTIESLPDRPPDGPSAAPPGRTPGRTPGASSSPGTSPSPVPTATSSLPSSGGSGSPGTTVCVLSPGVVLCPKSFTIAGNASGLYPGRTVQLGLTIENPNGADIRVASIAVSVAGSSSPSCGTSNLRPTDYTGPGFVVPANGSRTVSLPLTMSHAAPDACQDVTFTMSYAGKAEAA